VFALIAPFEVKHNLKKYFIYDEDICCMKSIT